MSWLDRLKAHTSGTVGLPQHCQNRQNPGSGSFGSATGGRAPATQGVDDAAADAREAFEERAAIMEYDGGLSRAEAEAQAAAAHLTARASPEPRRWRGEGLDLGDLRPCLWCRNLTRSGRCLAAWRGELRAARDYEPTFPSQPQRCIGYRPFADEPDQRPGRERWPEMVEWQAPQDAV